MTGAQGAVVVRAGRLTSGAVTGRCTERDGLLVPSGGGRVEVAGGCSEGPTARADRASYRKFSTSRGFQYPFLHVSSIYRAILHISNYGFHPARIMTFVLHGKHRNQTSSRHALSPRSNGRTTPGPNRSSERLADRHQEAISAIFGFRFSSRFCS